MKSKITITIILLTIASGIYITFFTDSDFLDDNDSGINLVEEKIRDDEEKEGLYTNAQFGFSFTKPEGYNVGEIEESVSTVILIQSDEVESGLQILITPFGGDDFDITKTVIQSEIPNIKISRERNISLGGIKGLLFESDSPSFDASSIEAWFAYNGNIYQISAYKDDKSLVEEVLKTWSFR